MHDVNHQNNIPLNQGSLNVTVITASYNSQKYLRETVESVANQSSLPREHLIIDDCSTDDSLALAKQLATEFRHVRVIEHILNRGGPAALNTGINAATTKYIGILDSDDVAFPGWLATTIHILDSDSSIGLVGGGCIIMTEIGERTGEIKYCEKTGDVTQEIKNGKYLILHSGTVLYTDLIKSIGGYSEVLRSAEDKDMYINIANESLLFHTGKPHVYYRRFASSESRKTKEFSDLMDGYFKSKVSLLNRGESINKSYEILADEIKKMSEVQRIEKLNDGGYEFEMANAFVNGKRYKLAYDYYIKAFRNGYSVFTATKTFLKFLVKPVIPNSLLNYYKKSTA